MVLASESFVRSSGRSPMGKLIGYAHAGVEPRIMGMGPVPAVRKVLDRTGLKIDEIDVFEVNEAFAAQALAVVRELGLPPDRTNPNGSGISLGHPIAATGAILTVKSLYELKRTGGKYALVTMCIGGGQGIAAIFERWGWRQARDRHISRRIGMDSVSYTAMSPLSFLERSGRVWPGKTAVIYGARRLTYRELAAEAQRVAGALRASGVGPGDRVAYLMPNLPEMLIAHYAVPLAGAVLVAVNTRLTAEEVAYILSHSGAKIVVVDAELLPTAVAAAKDVEAVTELVVAEDTELAPADPDLSGEPRLVSYSEFLARGTQEPLPWSISDELAPIAVNYTSGTTGRPKGVIYTHRGAYLNCFGEIIHSRHDENSVYLWTLPMFHCNGWCTPWSLTAIGGTHVCLREVRGDAIWRQLREHGVTHLNAAPTVVSSILNAPEAGPLARPVLITTAGAPPSPTTIAQMERMGFQIVHVYGLTETYGPISYCQSQPQWAGLSSEERSVLQARQGVSMIQAEGLRVVDQEMADVPADGSTMGEIVMRGNNVMAGYYLDPEATAEAFAAAGSTAVTSAHHPTITARPQVRGDPPRPGTGRSPGPSGAESGRTPG